MVPLSWEDLASYLYFEKKLDRSNDASYRSHFKKIDNFFKNCPFDKVNVNRFFAVCQSQGKANESMNSYLKLMKNICNACDLHFLDSYTYFRKQQVVHRLLTVEEVKKLISCYIEKGYNKDSLTINCRWSTAIHFLVVTGCRVGEMCNLRWCDVFPDKVIINAETCKTDRPRVIPIKTETYDLIKRLIKFEHNYVFGDHRGKMVPGNFNLELKFRSRYLKLRDANKIHAHQFRFFAAVMWRKAGVPIDVISKILGHESIETTSKYYQTYTTDEMIDAINLSPLFLDKVSFETVKRRAREFCEFVSLTTFPLHTQIKSDLLIVQVENV